MIKWQPQHKEVIRDFLSYLNKYFNAKSDDYIVKGGTALMMCYKLDRFSEDIDLDGARPGITDIVRDYCKLRGYDSRIAKDTDTVKRALVHYGNEAHPLKIETSYRKRHIPENEVTRINNISVYKIDVLCAQKLAAFAGRDKLRDLYDLAYICDTYWDELGHSVQTLVAETVSMKGLEQFDYLISTQKDELIDENKLAEAYLRLFEKANLYVPENRGIAVAEKDIHKAKSR
jgi:predicted nucleotidyltransferase component of viral defense system